MYPSQVNLLNVNLIILKSNGGLIVKIKIQKGDITEIEADAIVNAANNRGMMGGGVAGAIKRKGGKEIEEEAIKKGPWDIGGAIVTKAGRLRAKFVIHAATMGLDFKTDSEKIKSATKSAMEKAVKLGVESVAFPALGAGVGRMPIEKVAKFMLDEILKFKDKELPKEVYLVLYSDNDYRSFLKVAKDMGIRENK